METGGDPTEAATPDAVVVYRTARAGGGDAPLSLDIYRPEGAPHGTVIYLHPGGFHSGDRDMAGPIAREVTARGMALVSASYRLRGRKPELAAPFARLSHRLAQLTPDGYQLPRPFRGRPAHAATEDGLAALYWVARDGSAHGLDSKRLLLAGVSAGGIVAANIAFLAPALGIARPRLAAVAVLSGALANLPMCDLSRGPALLWVHGRDDRRVSAESAEAAARAAKGRPAPTEFRFIDHKVHGEFLWRGRKGLPGATEIERRAVIWDFLERHADFQEPPCVA